MSPGSETLLEHPLPPLRVRIGLGSLFLGHRSGGVHGVRVGYFVPAYTFTQDACAPAFLVERVLAGRAMYDPGQVFQCYKRNGEEPLVFCG